MPSKEVLTFQHKGHAYTVSLWGERVEGVSRSGKWLDVHSPIAKEVVALARVKLIEKACGL